MKLSNGTMKSSNSRRRRTGGGRGPGGARRLGGVRHRLDHHRRCSGSGDVLGASSLGVGANASQRVVSWYTSANTAQSVQVAPTSQLVDGEFPASAITFAATVAANTVNGGFNGHAILDGLQENTAYSYRVGADGAWSATYAFKTQKFDGDFDFLFFGDPQIGSSGERAKDGAGWADTLNVALAANPNAELLVSGGDQVETANTETQWNAFLASDKLRQYPWAATIGNHDVGGKAYDQHFWTPNTDRSAPFYSGSATTQSGGDYWYIYKGVLFIDLNSNAYANGTDAAHIGYVTNVVNAHGAEAKYTVLVYHHSIYSPADARQRQRQQAAPPGLPDRLLEPRRRPGPAGPRSQLLAQLRDQERPEGERRPSSPVPPRCPQGPGGVIYVTGNSASGSKYYDLSTPASPARTSARTRWTRRASATGPTRSRTRSTSAPTSRSRCATTRSSSRTSAAAPAPPRTPRSSVGNVSWCGPNSGASPAQPVGSVGRQGRHPRG